MTTAPNLKDFAIDVKSFALSLESQEVCANKIIGESSGLNEPMAINMVKASSEKVASEVEDGKDDDLAFQVNPYHRKSMNVPKELTTLAKELTTLEH